MRQGRQLNVTVVSEELADPWFRVLVLQCRNARTRLDV